jgi:hypothetical protein
VVTGAELTGVVTGAGLAGVRTGAGPAGVVTGAGLTGVVTAAGPAGVVTGLETKGSPGTGLPQPASASAKNITAMTSFSRMAASL